MPALGATDPADLEAPARAELGLSRQLEQPRGVAPHPSLGGSSGCPVWHGEEQLERWDAGEVTDVSELSLFRWSRRLEPYRQTGNRERSQIIGTQLLDLVTYITAWPDATDEMARWQSGQGRWRQRIGGSSSGGSSSAAAGSGAAGSGRAVVVAVARQRCRQRGGGVSSAVAALGEAARQQCGGSKQRGDGICSAVLAAGARWQRWQSSRAAGLRRWAARQRRRQHEGGDVAQRRR
jgi:hypothetical protein